MSDPTPAGTSPRQHTLRSTSVFAGRIAVALALVCIGTGCVGTDRSRGEAQPTPATTANPSAGHAADASVGSSVSSSVGLESDQVTDAPTTAEGDDLDLARHAAPDRLIGDWTLLAVRGVSIDAMLDGAPTRGTPGLIFTGGERVSGGGGVNQWMAGFDAEQLREGRFATGPIAGTKMAGPPAAMSTEAAYFDALRAVRRFDEPMLGQCVLRLLDEDGHELLRFARTGEHETQ